MAADGSIVIDVTLDDGQVVRGVGNINRELGNMEGSGNRAAIGIGKIMAALGLTAVVAKGIGMVRDALDGAIARYDTLNNFPNVLQLMGFDAEESSKAIAKLSDGIDGLPTTLDSVASTTQRIATLTGDLDGAVDTTLALNNAFLASGSSTADAQRGLEQYVQMLSKGEVDLAAWRTLQETMPVALNKTAEAFGFTGRSAQNDLYDALKEGDITFDQFNEKVISLSTATGGFADMAREGSKGIATSWQNMKTSIVKGVADVIGAIDEALGGTGSIADIIDGMKDRVKSAFSTIVSVIPPVVQGLVSVYNALKPWVPLLASVVAGFVAFGVINSIISGVSTAIAVFTGLRAAMTGVQLATNAARAAQVAYNLVLSLNPWVAIGAAIVAAAVLVFIYWEPIKEFFINLWESIKTNGLLVWEALKVAWAATVEWLKGIWSSVSEFFVTLWAGIQAGAAAAWQAITMVVMTILQPFIAGFMNIWNGMKDGVMMIMEGLSAFFSGIWEIIKNVFLGAVLLIINLVTGNFDEMRSNAAQIMRNIALAIQQIWNGIKTFFNGVLLAIIGFVRAQFQNMRSVITSVSNGIRSLISSIWNGIKSLFITVLANILKTVRNKFDDMKSSIRDKMNNALDTIKGIWDSVMAFFQGIDLAQIGKDIIQGLINGIKSKVEAVGRAVKDVTDAITGKIKSILNINSPSKVTAQLGAWTGEGLALGIEGERRAVEKAAGVLADASVPNVQQTGFRNPLRGVRAPLSNIMPFTRITHEVAVSSATTNTGSTEKRYVIEIPFILNGRELAREIVDPVTELQHRQSNRVRRRPR